MPGRELTYKKYNLNIYNPDLTDGFYEMPIIRKCNITPSRLIGFNEVLSAKDVDCGVHMFIDDYQFERLWNQPDRYVNKLSQFQCVFSPDFSLYMDMPLAMKVWNVYRSRLIGQYMQSNGVNVIPTISWAEPSTYSFCFDGIEKGSIVAISTIGCINDDLANSILRDGIINMIDAINPTKILGYGKKIQIETYGTPIVWFTNERIERVRKYGRKRSVI